MARSWRLAAAYLAVALLAGHAGAQDDVDKEQCAGLETLTADKGSFGDGSSTDKTYKVPNNCTWRIEPDGGAPDGITLVFERFQLAMGDDYLFVRDGADSSPLAAFTGQMPPLTAVHFDANSLEVTFLAQSLGTVNVEPGGDGFLAHWHSDGTCYNMCAGGGSSFGTCTKSGLCDCNGKSTGADCSIPLPSAAANIVPAPAGGSATGLITQGEVAPGETKFFQIDIPPNDDIQDKALLVELTFPAGVGLARPLLLLANATAPPGGPVPLLKYSAEGEEACSDGDEFGCAWLPSTDGDMSPVPDSRVTFQGPTVDYVTMGPVLLRQAPPDYPPFEFGTVRVPALPTFNLYSFKDFAAAEAKADYQHIFVPKDDPFGDLLLLADGKWVVGVMNQPAIQGHPEGLEDLVFELRVTVQAAGGNATEAALCPLQCSGNGRCVQDDPSELGKCECVPNYTGLACRDPVDMLTPGQVSTPSPLQPGQFANFLVDVPVAKLSDQLYIEVESASQLSDLKLLVSSSSSSIWQDIPFPSDDAMVVQCRNSPVGVGPPDNLYCAYSFNVTFAAGVGPMGGSPSKRGHIGILIPPEEHVVYNNETGTYDPVKEYAIAVYNPPNSLSDLKYSLMASWHPIAQSTPCPFLCSGHGQCSFQGVCQCDLPQYVGVQCNQQAEPLQVGSPGVQGTVDIADSAHYYVNVNQSSKLLVELTHTNLNSLPVLQVGKGNIFSLVRDEGLKWQDQESSWCSGIECSTEYTHEIVLDATPGTYFITVENSAYKLRSYGSDLSLTSDDLSKYGEPMDFELRVRSFTSESGEAACYGDCSGKGKCTKDKAPICDCDAGFFGIDCSIQPRTLELDDKPGAPWAGLEDTIRSGHYQYYSLDVARGSRSFIVGLESDYSFHQDRTLDVVMVASKDKLPKLCVREDSDCVSDYDIMAQYAKFDSEAGAVVYDMVIDDGRIGNDSISVPGQWYVAVYHGFSGGEEFTYEIASRHYKFSVCPDQYCSDRGTCNWTSGKCECRKGYVGETCESKVVQLQPGVAPIKDTVELGESIFLKMPVNCTGQDHQLRISGSSSLSTALLFAQKGGIPSGDINDLDGLVFAGVGVEPMRIYDAQPSDYFVELHNPVDGIMPINDISVDWAVSGTQANSAGRDDCEYPTGSLYLTATAGDGPYEVLSLDDGMMQLNAENPPFKWAYNENPVLDRDIPVEQRSEGALAEASYGMCSGCYLQDRPDYGLTGLGEVKGQLAVGRSPLDAGTPSFFYLDQLLYKFPGLYNSSDVIRRGGDVLEGLEMQYQHTDGDDDGWDYEACKPLINADEVRGKICVVARGTCTFVMKTKTCQDAGAVGVIIVDASAPFTYSFTSAAAPAGSETADITIPTVTIGSLMASHILSMASKGSKLYTQQVDITMGSYMCPPGEFCPSCGEFIYGEGCSVRCPGLLPDLSAACSGKGECKLRNETTAECECVKGFRGSRCHLKSIAIRGEDFIRGEEEPSSSSVNKSMIAGAFFGTLLAVVIGGTVAGLTVWLVRRRRGRRAAAAALGAGVAPEGSASKSVAGSSVGRRGDTRFFEMTESDAAIAGEPQAQEIGLTPMPEKGEDP